MNESTMHDDDADLAALRSVAACESGDIITRSGVAALRRYLDKAEAARAQVVAVKDALAKRGPPGAKLAWVKKAIEKVAP